jgi:flagellar basal body-associated protein FliL
VPEGQGEGNSDDTVKANDPGSVDVGNKGATKIDLKNTLVMIVVAVIAAGCAFVFVTRIHSSKDAYDITKSADAFTSEPSSDDADKDREDGNDSDTEKEEKPKEAKSKSKDKEEKKDKKGNDENGKSNSVLGKILVPMDSIVVNLGKADSKRYLRVIISLEVKNSEIEETIKANNVVFRDKLVSYLSSKHVSEVSAQASHLGLRTEIKSILNSELLGSEDAISQVYFSDFIIQ